MIDKTLAAENIDSFTVVGIPDIHDPPQWVDHVVSLVPGFSAVFTNNAFTASLFDEKGYKVIKPGFHKKETYSGDHIRSAMRKKQSWMNLVHPAIQEYLTKIDAESRIQHIQE